VGTISSIVSTVKWRFLDCVVALQELLAWDDADGSEYAGGEYKMFREAGSECGFILPDA